MPVIVFASSKGGAGKTTACTVLACELARQGAPKNIGVSLIDADPNQHSAGWAALEGKPDNIKVYADVTEESILDAIEEAREQNAFVLIDLEGVASNAVTYAVSQADLVIIPCQASQNDAKEAVRTVKTIRNSGRMIGREIPYSVLFTRASAAFYTKNAKYIAQEFEGAGVDLFSVSLIDREAFKSIFSFGGSVHALEAANKKEQASIDKAAENARYFTEEVKQKLKAAVSNQSKKGAA